MKRPKNLSSSLERRLSGYALAASAAGVSLLALARPTAAEIVYTKTRRAIPEQGSLPLDLNRDGKADFLFHGLASRAAAAAMHQECPCSVTH